MLLSSEISARGSFVSMAIVSSCLLIGPAAVRGVVRGCIKGCIKG